MSKRLVIIIFMGIMFCGLSAPAFALSTLSVNAIPNFNTNIVTYVVTFQADPEAHSIH